MTVGDFASARVDRRFRLVYLLRNTITNLTSQDEQVDCFRNAATHLGYEEYDVAAQIAISHHHWTDRPVCPKRTKPMKKQGRSTMRRGDAVADHVIDQVLRRAG